MKQLLGILVMLFWCNVGFADIKKIYNSDIDYSVYNLIVDRYEEYTKSVENDDFCDGAIVPSANLFTDKLNCVYERIKYHLKKNKINYEILVDLTHNWYTALYSNARRADSLMLRGYDPLNEYGKALGKLSEKFKREFEEELKKIALEENAKYPEDGSPSTDIASSGSGFFINRKGYFVTNYHVVAECNDKSKITFKEKDVDAKLIAKDQFLDLALLRAKVKPENFLNLSTSPPEKIQKIYVAGYPFGKGLSDDLKITQGIISSLKGYGDNSNEIQIDAAINPGNSGGPIVNETGELVAVAVSGMAKDMSEGINFGIKASSVKNFLDINKIKYSTKGLSLYSTNTKKLNNILEASTVYIFCN